MLELKQIQYFIACVEQGSFSNAAVRLFTTQSNVSKVIKSFEDELKIKLFERQIRGIRLTAEGQEIYYHAILIQNHVDEIMQFQKLYYKK